MLTQGKVILRYPVKQRLKTNPECYLNYIQRIDTECYLQTVVPRPCGCITDDEGPPTPRTGPCRPGAAPDGPIDGTPRPAARPRPGPPEAPGRGTRAIPSYKVVIIKNCNLTLIDNYVCHGLQHGIYIVIQVLIYQSSVLTYA